MASINYAAKEISVKIVYYGPGLSGKTTNLQVIHRKTPPTSRSDMVSLATETDRTLFFDFLPIDLGTIKGFATKFQLYTVPGQVYYNATRKLVLRGVDGLVFVADSAADKMQENLESFQNLEDNLAEYGYKRENIPIVLQFNKRDLPNALPVEEIDKQLNKYHLPWNEAVAFKGQGIFESLKMIGKLVIDNLNRKYNTQSVGSPLGARPGGVAKPAPGAPGAPGGAPGAPGGAPGAPGGAPGAPMAAPPPPQQQAPAPPPPQQAPAPPQQAPAPPPQQAPAPPPQQAPQPQQAPPMADPFASSPQPAAQPQQAPQPESDPMSFGSINFEGEGGGQAPPQQQQFQQAPPQQQQFQQAPPQQQQFQQAPPQQQFQQAPPQQQQFQQAPPQQQQFQQAPPQQQQFQQAPPQQQQFQQAPPQQQQFQQAPPQQQQFQQAPPQQQAPGNDAEGGDVFDDTMYFTSVNTDKPRKKVKRPVNPKNAQNKGLLGKLFNRGS